MSPVGGSRDKGRLRAGCRRRAGGRRSLGGVGRGRACCAPTCARFRAEVRSDIGGLRATRPCACSRGSARRRSAGHSAAVWSDVEAGQQIHRETPRRRRETSSTASKRRQGAIEASFGPRSPEGGAALLATTIWQHLPWRSTIPASSAASKPPERGHRADSRQAPARSGNTAMGRAGVSDPPGTPEVLR